MPLWSLDTMPGRYLEFPLGYAGIPFNRRRAVGSREGLAAWARAELCRPGLQPNRHMSRGSVWGAVWLAEQLRRGLEAEGSGSLGGKTARKISSTDPVWS